MVGPQSFQGDPAYVASKGGLEALMRALAVELGEHGIAANAIAPGFFLTEGNARFFSHPRVAELARRIPLRRFGRPEELVGRGHLPGLRRRVVHHGPGADGRRGTLGRAVISKPSISEGRHGFAGASRAANGGLGGRPEPPI